MKRKKHSGDQGSIDYNEYRILKNNRIYNNVAYSVKKNVMEQEKQSMEGAEISTNTYP